MNVDTDLERNFEVQGFKLMLMGMPLGEPFKDNPDVPSNRNQLTHKIAVGQDEPEILNVVGYVSKIRNSPEIWVARDTYGYATVNGTSARAVARLFVHAALCAAECVTEGMVAIGEA